MAFADCGFEFLLHLGLCLAQHVLDDALFGLQVIARGVAALPAAILALPESLSIDYSDAKYTRFTPKIAAALKVIFRVVESGGFTV